MYELYQWEKVQVFAENRYDELFPFIPQSTSHGNDIPLFSFTLIEARNIDTIMKIKPFNTDHFSCRTGRPPPSHQTELNTVHPFFTNLQ